MLHSEEMSNEVDRVVTAIRADRNKTSSAFRRPSSDISPSFTTNFKPSYLNALSTKYHQK